MASNVNPAEPVAGLVGAVRALLSALESTPLVHTVTNHVPISGSTSTTLRVLGSARLRQFHDATGDPVRQLGLHRGD